MGIYVNAYGRRVTVGFYANTNRRRLLLTETALDAGGTRLYFFSSPSLFSLRAKRI
jgi:hypothetical protein